MNRKNRLLNPKDTLTAEIPEDQRYLEEPLLWPFLIAVLAFSLLTQGCITVHKEVVPSSSQTPNHPLVSNAIAENEWPQPMKNLEAGQIEFISPVATDDGRHRDDTLRTLPRLD
jgi:hypothetical protein